MNNSQIFKIKIMKNNYVKGGLLVLMLMAITYPIAQRLKMQEVLDGIAYISYFENLASNFGSELQGRCARNKHLYKTITQPHVFGAHILA